MPIQGDPSFTIPIGVLVAGQRSRESTDGTQWAEIEDIPRVAPRREVADGYANLHPDWPADPRIEAIGIATDSRGAVSVWIPLAGGPPRAEGDEVMLRVDGNGNDLTIALR